ncbi:MAG: hypothetical protein R3F22_11610 [Lysobacteraceae bacterium]
MSGRHEFSHDHAFTVRTPSKGRARLRHTAFVGAFAALSLSMSFTVVAQEPRAAEYETIENDTLWEMIADWLRSGESSSETHTADKDDRSGSGNEQENGGN